MKSGIQFFIVLILSAPFAMAENMGLGQGRLFLGSTNVSPSMLNTELTALGQKNINLNNQYGVEITFPMSQNLRLGLRYTHRVTSQSGVATVASGADDKAELQQDGLMGIARMPLFKSDHVYFDLFAGAGANKSTYTEKNSTQDGTLEKSASPVLAAGASIGFGYKKYFLFFEGGFESNKLEDLSKSGNINGNVTAIDMSGSYLTIGLMFDEIPIFSK